MGFHFCLCFFSWYSYKSYKLCNWIKNCVLTAGIKKCKPINKKKKKKHDKILLTAKSEWNSTEVQISNKALIDSSICHDEFLLIDNVLKEFYDMEEEIN